MAIGPDEAGAFRKAPAEPRGKGVVARRQAKAARDVALARVEPLAIRGEPLRGDQIQTGLAALERARDDWETRWLVLS